MNLCVLSIEPQNRPLLFSDTEGQKAEPDFNSVPNPHVTCPFGGLERVTCGKSQKEMREIPENPRICFCPRCCSRLKS